MIRSLEGLRGLAALVVALYHLKLAGSGLAIVKHGYLFVDLFFILSGVVIYRAYGSWLSHGTRKYYLQFLIRRFGRLWPLLIFSILFYLAVANGMVLLKRLAMHSEYAGLLRRPEAMAYVLPAPEEALGLLAMTHGLGMFDHLLLNGPSWSISAEFYTYVLFGLVCIGIGSRRIPMLLGILSVLGYALCVWASVLQGHCEVGGKCLSLTYDFGFPRALAGFFLGALGWHALGGRRLDSLQWPAGLLVLGLFAALDSQPALAFLMPPAMCLLILAVSNDSGSLARLLSCRPCQILGQRSYSIYLLHMPLVLIFGTVARFSSQSWIDMLLSLAFCATLVWLSGWTYRLVESPARHYFNELAGRIGTSPAQATALVAPSRSGK